MMNMFMMMKGHGKGASSDLSSWYLPPSSDRKKSKESRRKKDAKEAEDEDEEAPEKEEGGRRPPEGGRRPPDKDPSEDPSSEPTEETGSSVNTSEVRSLLRRRARVREERPKSSLGSVKIEEFYGDRSKYLKWKRAVQAQQQLYKLEEEELAMLIYLSTKKDARDCLDQLTLSEYTRPGGLKLVWRLLDEGFGESEDELFERAETEFNTYRRLPGQSVATYLGQLKRLKAQYLRVDPETRISDRAWSQRMLNRASLTRRERLDCFFSAGGRYSSREVEIALRHRCGRIHEEERRLPMSTIRHHKKMMPRSSAKKGEGKGGGKKKVYLTMEGEAEDFEEEEDLEAEEGAYEAYLENREEAEDEMDAIEEGVEDEEIEEEGLEEEELKEAWAAGWKAKAQQAEKKKFRGWKSDGKAQDDKRKRNSTCSSCGEVGHWRGDPECKNGKAGKDPPHKRKEQARTMKPGPTNTHEANVIRYKYVV